MEKRAGSRPTIRVLMEPHARLERQLEAELEGIRSEQADIDQRLADDRRQVADLEVNAALSGTATVQETTAVRRKLESRRSDLREAELLTEAKLQRVRALRPQLEARAKAEVWAALEADLKAALADVVPTLRAVIQKVGVVNDVYDDLLEQMNYRLTGLSIFEQDLIAVNHWHHALDRLNEESFEKWVARMQASGLLTSEHQNTGQV